MSSLRRPVIVFLVATFVHSAWLAGLQLVTRLDVQLVTIPQLGPALGLLTTWLLLRRELTALLPRVEPTPRLLRRVAVAGGWMAGYVLLTLLLARQVDVLPSGSLLTGGTLVLLVLLQLMGALGEEVGWRGFLQPVLTRRIGPLPAAVVVGLIWSVWHVDRLTNVGLFVGFALTSIALSVAWGQLTGGSWWQRGLVAGLMHAVVNLVLALGLDPTAFDGAGPVAMLPVAVPPIALAVAVWLVSRGRPARSPGARSTPGDPGHAGRATSG